MKNIYSPRFTFVSGELISFMSTFFFPPSRLTVRNQIPREHKNMRIGTPRLANERKLDK